MRRPILGTLFALAACLTLSAPATAITLQRHVVIPHGVTRKAEQHRVVRWHVSLDSDHDGIWNRPDDCDHEAGPRSNGGCKPDPVTTSVSEGIAPGPASSSETASAAGVCGGTTPYYGGGQCWAIPYDIVLCESGGSYTAYNPSGASGAYQLMIGGGGSPAEQDAAAAALWDGGAGASNWVCAG